jgi:hypothetical protein
MISVAQTLLVATLVEKGGGNGNVYVRFYYGFYSVDVAVAFLNHFFDRWQTLRKRLENKYYSKTVSITPLFLLGYAVGRRIAGAQAFASPEYLTRETSR